MSNRKVIITISIDNEQLDKLDDLARCCGKSRSGIITDLIAERLDYIETIAEINKEFTKEN